MNTPTFLDYCKFSLAREFSTPEGESFLYVKSRAERWGDRFVAPIFGSVDRVLKNIKKPLVITAIAITLVVAVTVLFYPSSHIASLLYSVTTSLAITPEKLKFALFLLTESTLLGMGMRAFSRFNNPSLVAQWKNHQALPIPVGAIRI